VIKDGLQAASSGSAALIPLCLLITIIRGEIESDTVARNALYREKCLTSTVTTMAQSRSVVFKRRLEHSSAIIGRQNAM